MTTRKRVVSALACFGVLASLSITSYAGSDELPPKTDDLRVAVLDIPDKDNAFHYFNQAAQSIYWPKDKEPLVLSILEGEKWDLKLVDELVGKNAETFRYVEEGLACSHFQVPEITSLYTTLPYLGPWRSIARLMSIRALSLYRSGEQKEAFDVAMQVIKFGHMIEDSRGSFIHYLVGRAAKGIGLTRVRRMVRGTTLATDTLTTYVEQLDEYKANEKGLANAIRLEYELISKSLDDIVAGKYGPEKLGIQRPKMRSLRQLQPNKTKRMFAGAYRTMIGNIPKSYIAGERFAKSSYQGRFSTVRLWWSGNASGHVILDMFGPTLDKSQLWKCRENVSVSATQVLLAMKCYSVKTGELPKSLEELIPEYFQQIPRDDFDGNPMRYSPDKNIIYCVGEDLKDSGGSEPEDLWKTEDPAFIIDF